MRSKLFGLLLLIHAMPLITVGQEPNNNTDHYFKAKNEIVDMLEGKVPLSYERAIYLIENAWWDGELDDDLFDAFIANGINHIKTIEQQSTYIYLIPNDPKPFHEILKDKSREDAGFNSTARVNFAIYAYLTDTLKFVRPDSTLYTNYPSSYSHSDPFGTVDWKNTQVSNLLWNGEGNCFALASLYKIFSERLHSDADICTAPGHIYISHKDNKGTQFNIELATRSFPGAGTIATLSYTTMDAIKNGISLRQLTTKQAVALTLVYLAKGYEDKFSQREDSDSFLLNCAELALHYDSLNLNAMLLKSEVLERILIAKRQPIEHLRSYPVFQEYQSHIQKLYSLGYREMPKNMKDILIRGLMKDTITQLAQKNYLNAGKLKSRTNRTSYASLSGGLFDETITTKPVEQFGSTLFDTRTQTIKGFVLQQQQLNSYTFDPVLFAWNIDPLAHKAPGWNPYNFCLHSPVYYIDPTGEYPIYFMTRSYAPFKTFGPGNEWHGDNRGHSIEKYASYRTRVIITHDTELKTTHADGGRSRSYTIDKKKDAYSPTHTSNRSKGSDIDVHSYGGNEAQIGAPDIDQFTKFTTKIEGNINKDHILSITGTISGDDFPNQESLIYDAKGNTLWLGNFETSGDRQWGPVKNLWGKDEDDVHINVNIRIKVNSEGTFKGVMQKDKDGKENMISIDEWNKNFR